MSVNRIVLCSNIIIYYNVKNNEIISNEIWLVRSKDDVAKLEQRKWILQSRNLYVSFSSYMRSSGGLFYWRKTTEDER